MTDLTAITEGIALFKSGMEGIRSAFGIWKDIRAAMPEGSQRDEVTRALEQSEQQFRIAEAQIAKGLGYTLCECAFPPTPMLTVGWINGRVVSSAVHRCPRCGITDNRGLGWSPTAALKAYADKLLSGNGSGDGSVGSDQ
jgi:hypothetical protein